MIKDHSFAAACLSWNSFQELVVAVMREDEDDCNLWGITEEERKRQLFLAINYLFNLPQKPEYGRKEWLNEIYKKNKKNIGPAGSLSWTILFGEIPFEGEIIVTEWGVFPGIVSLMQVNDPMTCNSFGITEEERKHEVLISAMCVYARKKTVELEALEKLEKLGKE